MDDNHLRSHMYIKFKMVDWPCATCGCSLYRRSHTPRLSHIGHLGKLVGLEKGWGTESKFYRTNHFISLNHFFPLFMFIFYFLKLRHQTYQRVKCSSEIILPD